MTPVIGIVVIGRNEGERLLRCLASVSGAAAVVYVDSASSDGSAEAAAARGAFVERLSPDRPFTAARARNAGVRRLRADVPGVELVHFVDGDCEIVPGWLAEAVAFLRENPGYAAACGRRRERHPEQSIYNRLTDIEWDTAIGDATDTGGDAIYRIDALERVGGFRDDLIAGEEPELGLRLRRAGYRIRRLDREMTLHDSNLTHFAQWWARQVRAGHACAEAAALHGRGPERFFVRRLASNCFWGLALPALTLAGFTLSAYAGFAAIAVYGLFWWRVASHAHNAPERGWYALGILLGKFAGARGAWLYAWSTLSRRRTSLIEPREVAR